MSTPNTLTLDDISEAANAEYSHLTIPLETNPDGEVVRSVTLINALQLPKDKRKALTSIQSIIDDDPEGDIADVLEAGVRIAAHDDSAGAEALIEKLGGNAARLAIVFNRYSNTTQAPEA